ncbi:hypothetical protein ACWV26_09165 [Rummeliibacillus sp. JY-2-4R]
MKRFFWYITWIIIISFLIYCGLRLEKFLEQQSEMSYDILSIMIFTYIFPIFVGILLRLPRFIFENKGKKKWSFDWVKIIGIAIPVLYIVILPYLAYTSFADRLLFVEQFLSLGQAKTTLTTIAGIVFGYILLDSVKSYKKFFKTTYILSS